MTAAPRPPHMEAFCRWLACHACVTGTNVSQYCRTWGISRALFYSWAHERVLSPDEIASLLAALGARIEGDRIRHAATDGFWLPDGSLSPAILARVEGSGYNLLLLFGYYGALAANLPSRATLWRRVKACRSWRQVAQRHGISRCLLCRICEPLRAKLAESRPPPLPPAERKGRNAAVVAEAQSGNTLRAIGKRHGLSAERVRQILQMHGLQPAQSRLTAQRAQNAQRLREASCLLRSDGLVAALRHLVSTCAWNPEKAWRRLLIADPSGVRHVYRVQRQAWLAAIVAHRHLIQTQCSAAITRRNITIRQVARETQVNYVTACAIIRGRYLGTASRRIASYLGIPEPPELRRPSLAQIRAEALAACQGD